MTTAIALYDYSLAGSSSDGSLVQKLYILRQVATYSCQACGATFERTSPGRGRPEPGLCDKCEAEAFVGYAVSNSLRTVYIVRRPQPETPEVITL